ncbi:MAG: pantetheine-phosphate adenylyltransferase [Clostridia bacterium]|nr:pantetheine-phosphate adenylyltransferase [Clostridia bacterium]
MNKTIAVCPGSFDPITMGHLDIISRSSKMFDKVIVVVMSNVYKNGSSFTVEQRKKMIEKTVGELGNVEVDSYEGLLADYAALKGAGVIVKGLRAMSDFEYEFQMALANKKLNPNLETVFLTTSAENMYLSSSMVKQIASMGGDISDFVPKAIYSDITEKFSDKNQEE